MALLYQLYPAFYIQIGLPDVASTTGSTEWQLQELPIHLFPLTASVTPSFGNLPDPQDFSWPHYQDMLSAPVNQEHFSRLEEWLSPEAAPPSENFFFQQLKSGNPPQRTWYACLPERSAVDQHLHLFYFQTHAQNILARKMRRLLREYRYIARYRRQFLLLSLRERQVLTLVASGLTNPQIAEQLGISRRTVESHRKNINRKLAMNNTAQLVRFALAFELT